MVRAACVTAALLACAVDGARADPALGDLSDGLAPPNTIRSESRRETSLYFAGFDLWRGGGSFYGGLQWAPGGLNDNGFTLKLLLAEGTYRYLSGTTTIRGTGLLAAILPGWRIKRGDLEIKVFAGLDLQNHRTSPDDPASSLRGNHAGLRVNTELWWEPTSTLMLASSVSASTIGNSFGVRAAAGWRVSDRFWAGPEVEASGDKVYHQYRAGLHVTSFRMAAFEWSFGAGYVEDNSDRAGFYGRVSLLTRR
jgi:hypothetical protein